ncbi:ankyrin repeat domain-containing protein [Erwinia sp.]|uniref:ankyrin repeat domain-containing protein n=1 Tax=Erwinia citreus TaxID=558 RepID=UPI0039173527
MKVPPAEEYFSGTQLELAQTISDVRVKDVERLAKNTDLNKPGAKEMTLLMYALQTSANNKKDSLDIVTLLVKAGADPLQQVPDMGSVAQVVARSDSPVYMEALLEGGMSPNAIVEDTPIIFYSATEHSFNVLKLLVEKGADVNKKDSLGQNVLIEALASMQLDQVEWLLLNGADPSVKTVNGWQFGNMLEKTINREGDVKSKTGSKLEEIRVIAIKKGMKWPPQPY